jgi:hypothetical protein
MKDRAQAPRRTVPNDKYKPEFSGLTEEKGSVMLQIKLGLVDITGTVDPQVMAAAANALNVQVTRDVPQYWNISATVGYLPSHEKIPQGVWPVQLVKSLPPGEGGFHMTKNNQPYAKVIVTPGSNEWTVDASHEAIEMLIDPAGNRLQTSNAIAVKGGEIIEGVGQFEYLVEACDPCEDDSFSYQIGEISVSDFITPHFYEPKPITGTRYSFTGAITAPRQILKNGYISWVDPQSDEIQQLQNFGQPQIHNLGPASGLSLRQHVDALTRVKVPHPDKKSDKFKEKSKHEHAFAEAVAASARDRAKHYK